ncbi:hypothetical protein ABBZ21_18535 [Acinetobacter baumannii]|uniref:hypothetical protein n=1 Tax=Acinetobacter baumannii TaxID=470 RepID=UPI00385C60CB
MPRQNHSIEQVHAISKRFNTLVIDYLRTNYSELSRRLGYANSSTLHAVKKGKSLPDFLRLAHYHDKLTDKYGRKINLHWLITGVGDPMLKNDHNEYKFNDIIINIGNLNFQKKQEIFNILANILSS